MADAVSPLFADFEAWCASVEHSNLGMLAIGVVVSVGNLLVYRALGKYLRAAWGRRGNLAWRLAFLPYWVLLSPMLVLAAGGMHAARAQHEMLPGPVAVACMAFQFAVWVYGGCLLIAWLSRRAHASAGNVTRRIAKIEPPARGLGSPARRGFLRSSAIGMPAVIITGAAVGGVSSHLPPVVKNLRQPVRGDFAALRGLRIVQFSDVHIGSYLERDRLREITEAVNSLRPDIVVCTGDLIDNQLEQLEHATPMLRALKPRVGTFMCMGNHEYIAAAGDEAAVRNGLREGGATLLIDEARKVEIGRSHLWLGGTDFPGPPALGKRPITRESMDKVEADMRDDGAPRIVLAHHPKTFFEARERQIDLMLSGHTHGGQISLGRIGEHELTPNLPFEHYHRGLYEHEGRRLYVNSGIGSWLPIRINCPPEITLIELV